MLWFPAINRSIKGTSVNHSGQNLLLGRGGWTWGQVQKSEDLSKVALKLPWAVGPKRKLPHCSRGPTDSPGYGGASPGSRLLTGTPRFSPGSCAGVRGAGPGGASGPLLRVQVHIPSAGAQRRALGGLSLVQDLSCFTGTQMKCWISETLVSLLMATGMLCSIPNVSPLSICRLLFFQSFPIFMCLVASGASLVAQRVKHLSAMQETRVRSLGWEDPLEKQVAPHSSILAWKIPWTAEPDRLPSMGSQRVGHDWVTSLHFTWQH